jgi:hypothetical protein
MADPRLEDPNNNVFTVVAWVIFVSTALNSWQTERGPLGVL